MSTSANKLKLIVVGVASVAALLGKAVDSVGTVWSKAGRAAVETAPGALRAGTEAAAVAGDTERAVHAGARASRLGRTIQWVQTADTVATGADVVELLYEALDPEDDISAVPEEVVKSKDTVLCRREPGAVTVAAAGLKPVRVQVTASHPDSIAKEVAGAIEKTQPQLARRLEGAKAVLLCTSGAAVDTGALLRGKAQIVVARR